eukprot:7148707-Pyramimonas_sp.AAC.1
MAVRAWAIKRTLSKYSSIKQHKQAYLNPNMPNTKGACQHDRQYIVDVLVDLYEQLYLVTENSIHSCDMVSQTACPGSLPPISIEELNVAVKQLTTKKGADASGIAAEMIKAGGNHQRHALLM